MTRARQLSTVALVLALLMSLLAISGRAHPVANEPAAATIYVDGQIGVGSCTDYDLTSRSCGGGTQTAYATLTGAAAVAQPGDTVLIRQGTYNEQLVPQHSGTAGGRITYGNYAGEAVVLTGSFYPAAIILDTVGYIAVEGLMVQDCRWLEATDAHHNLIRDNVFLRTPASGTTGNVRFISSDHNQIVGNVLDDGNDNLLLIDSDHNLVEGNTITEGRHSVFSIRCSNYNLIRDNVFSNTQQKIGEVYDCGEDTTAVPHAFDATKHNVFEHNVFADASPYYSTSGGNGIQYAGQEGIIRRNVFYHTNVGLCMQVYGDEALYNHHNRAYHNVFYEDDCAGVSVRGDNLDNVFANNILFRNKGIGGGDCFGTGPAQIVYRGPLAASAFAFRRNNILNEVPGEAVIQEEFGSGNTLPYFEANYPALFSTNLEVAPGFTDEGSYDFTLKNNSSMIDAGGFLTWAVSSGSGTSLQVDDARYFHDGFGIEGVNGDLIQLEGQNGTATVVEIDYDSHTLTLDRPLAWHTGQGVSLAYQGTAPDIGAYEQVPEIVLSAAPGDRSIRLAWTVNVALPVTTTWRIDYYTRTASVYTATDPLSTTRSCVLTEHVFNYQWYTVTLHAMLGERSWLFDTERVMPTDKLVHLPLVLRSP